MIKKFFEFYSSEIYEITENDYYFNEIHCIKISDDKIKKILKLFNDIINDYYIDLTNRVIIKVKYVMYCTYTISYGEDDYYYLMINKGNEKSNMKYYKCDQFINLLKLINRKLKELNDKKVF